MIMLLEGIVYPDYQVSNLEIISLRNLKMEAVWTKNVNLVIVYKVKNRDEQELISVLGLDGIITYILVFQSE